MDFRFFAILVLLCRNSSQKDFRLNMCVVLESHSTSILADYNKVAAAVDLGILYVQQEVLPSNIFINKIFMDGGTACEDTGNNHIAALNALNLSIHSKGKSAACHVYLGPGCSQAAIDICNIADIYNVPVIAIPASGMTTVTNAPRSTFPMLIRMLYTLPSVARCIATALQELSFTATVVFVDLSLKFYKDLSEALSLFVRHDGRGTFKTRELDEEIPDTKCIELLKWSQSMARSLILFTHASLTRRLMLMAKDLGMTDGGYVFFTVELFVSNYWGLLSWKGDDGRDDDARQAFDSLIFLSIDETLTEGYPQFENDYKLAAATNYKYNFSNDPPEHEVNAVVHAFFDAVVLYGSAVKVVFESGQPLDKEGLVLAAMKSCRYPSPISTEIVMNSDGDRFLDYVIKDVLPNGLHEAVITINGTTWKSWKSGDFSWPGGTIPVDVPYCGYDDKDPKCAVSVTTIIVAPCVAVLLIISAVTLGKCLLKQKEQPNPHWWRISSNELDLMTGSGAKSTVSIRTENTRMVSDAIYPHDFANSSAPQQAEFRGVAVSVTKLPKQKYRPTSALIKEMNVCIKSLHHPNLVHFIGICLDKQGFCSYLLEEFSGKGTLQSVIASQGFDDTFRNSFLKDISEGMIFLHSSLVGSHGFLSSKTCYVNTKFVVKVSDYGITYFRNMEDLIPPKMSDNNRNFDELLWRAPEHLRETMPLKGTQKGIFYSFNKKYNELPAISQHLSGDVYSYAIITQEVITHSRPFCIPSTNEAIYKSEVKATVMAVKRGVIPPLRPKVAKGTCLTALYELMERCWEEQPGDRPPFTGVRDVYIKFVKSGGYGIIDLLLRKMEKYEKELKIEVAKKTEQFMDEKTRSDKLLRHMLPKAIADLLTNGQPVFPQTFPSVTIFFSDVVNFSDFCARIQPFQIIDVLNDLYCWGDTIMESYDVYKVEAVAEIFMVASGLPVENGTRHVTEMANLALQLRRDIVSFIVPHQPSEIFRIRTGMHSGPCVAGIVGVKMPRYCLFGDCVNTASRMQSTGEPMKIQVTSETKNLLDEIGGFRLEKRGQIFVKGKGNMTTFWLQDSSVLSLDVYPNQTWPAIFLDKHHDEQPEK